MITKSQIDEMTDLLAAQQIGFSGVFDDDAYARSDYAEKLQRRAARAGFGERWTGFAVQDGIWWDGVLRQAKNLVYDRLDDRNTITVRRVWVSFNHALGSQLPEAVLAAARQVGLTASWAGEGRAYRPGEAKPRTAKFNDMGSCVVVDDGLGEDL